MGEVLELRVVVFVALDFSPSFELDVSSLSRLDSERIHSPAVSCAPASMKNIAFQTLHINIFHSVSAVQIFSYLPQKSFVLSR